MKAEDYLKERRIENGSNHNWSNPSNDLLTSELMEDFAKAQSNQWISVEDRLPSELSKLLIYIENQDFITNGTVERNNIGEYEWREMYHGEIVEYVTHWMPLPTKPE